MWIRPHRPRRIAGMVLAIAAVLGAVIVAAPVDADPAEPLRMNHVQAKGSHNSYHVEPPQNVIDLYWAVAPELMPYLLQYTHEPLVEQFEDLGVRQVELDVFADPAGDKVYPPVGTAGWKVLHIEEIDMDSTCPLLVACLALIETWSDANPEHIPMNVMLEVKDADDFSGSNTPVPITPALLRDLDDTLRSVFDDDDLVTPDFVRGVGRSAGADGRGTVFADPESAILGYGWPLLDDTRGRIMITLDNRRVDYVDGDPTLAGRVAFPPSAPGSPDAAFVKLNDPIAGFDEIQRAVADGYMVRTRGDLPVETGLTRDDAMLTAALASGAHWVSGDYLTPSDYVRYDAEFATRYGLAFDPVNDSYETVIPGGTPARCNPITAPTGCRSTDVENLHAADQPDATIPDPTTTSMSATVGTPAPPPPAAQPQFTG